MSATLISLLNRHWLFSNLTAVEIDRVVRAARVETYAVDQYIFHQKDQSKHMYLILSGSVSIETLSLQGQVTRLATLSQAQVFGEFSLIDGHPRSASARVISTAEIMRLSQGDFLDLMQKNAGFSVALLRNMVTRMRRTNLQVEGLVFHRLRERILIALYDISSLQDDTIIRMTQSQLAENVSASREKVNAALKALERRGLIDLERGKIVLLDADAIKAEIENLLTL